MLLGDSEHTDNTSTLATGLSVGNLSAAAAALIDGIIGILSIMI